MKWITRERIRVNRTATCWLIRRFLDSEAEFLFVPAEEVTSVQASESAIGFDAPGATYPHQDAQGRCSFSALIHERLSNDPVLVEMARMVQAADIKGHLDDHPAALGLQLVTASHLWRATMKRLWNVQLSCMTHCMQRSVKGRRPHKLKRRVSVH